jgi:5-methylcytosine-specific restriction endonuclease McrA
MRSSLLNTEEGLKQCATCKDRKRATVDFFYKRKEAKDGLKSSCKECLLSKYKKYRENNKDKVKQKAKESREKNKNKIKNGYAKWREKNKNYGRDYYAKNSHKLRLKQRDYRARMTEDKLKIAKEKSALISLQWRLKNPEYSKDYAIKYRERNKIKLASISRNYKARKKLAEGSHTGEDIQRIIKKQINLCFWCNSELVKIHIDHYIPLSRGGSNDKKNLVASCPHCNLSKRNKMPEGFIKWKRTNNKTTLT